MIRLVQKLEILSGLATGVFAIAVTALVTCPRFAGDILGNGIYIGLAFVIAVGACLHGLRLKRAGFVVLVASAVLLVSISIGMALAGGLFLFCGAGDGTLILTPSAVAIVTMAFSIAVRRLSARPQSDAA